MTDRSLFGTDGVRGVAGRPPLDAATVTALGIALANRLAAAGEPQKVVLGGDTRESTAEIAGRLAAALAGGSIQVINAGVIPTPGVAWLIGHLDADAGIVISASHNPYPDNGIKLISREGRKFDPIDEHAIEKEALALLPVDGIEPDLPASDGSLVEAYRDHLLETVPAGALDGLHLIVDAAHGAASALAGEVFATTGADVEILHDRPDGTNINRDCGSTDPRSLQDRVRRSGATLGIALDGDADRAVLVDERGDLRDGDAILYLWASWLAEQGQLEPRAVVATSMSNLGLEKALAALEIRTVRCGVGDRAVVDTLHAEGLRLGGEQSGHIVDLGVSTTGDGLLTGLRMAAILAERRTALSRALAALRRFPQRLVNVEVGARPPIAQVPELAAAIDRAARDLGNDGRLVVRYSGTEPLLRIMVEGSDLEQVDRVVDALSKVAHHALPAVPPGVSA